MDIALATNSDNPMLLFGDCERFDDSSGYRVDIFVKSDGFSLETTFYFEEWPLTEFIRCLSEMESTLSGKATLKPMWENDYVEFEMLSLGHVLVSGEFSRPSPFEQKLKFGFETDQTCLAPFKNELATLARLKNA